MQTAHGNLHLEIQISRKSPVGLLRSTYREDGKVKHAQHGRITGCTRAQLQLLQAGFRGELGPQGSPEALKILQSKEYGASAALIQFAKQLQLHRILDSLRFCYEVAIKGTPLEGSELEIIRVPGHSRCHDCGRDVEMDDMLTRCACGSVNLSPPQGGDALRIKSMELQEAA